MAKNKNRKQGEPGNRASEPERADTEAKSDAAEGETPLSRIQGSPADVARKHQRRFGHN
ncbi:hypothetical protein [Streptomyces tsukubensis]|uniref:hypothetical protein n=1 Tax=Streptomyces tsukubensis TaxID=83656 RepID=UPI0015C2F7FD|nr:hypothetical protein [Streptomyces tsukubensis]